MISGNMVGSYSQIGKTFILVDDEGNEITGVCVDNPVVFTAGDSQVADGFIYAGDSGVSTGTREFIAYRTTVGSKAIMPGKNFSIPMSLHECYNYTKFQCIIAKYNKNINTSIETNKISLFNGVYNVNSAEKLADITKNDETKSIDLNIVNDTDDIYIVHFTTYKQEEL